MHPTGTQPVQQAVEKTPSAAFGSSFVAATYWKYALLLRKSPALHLALFEQPAPMDFFKEPVDTRTDPVGEDHGYDNPVAPGSGGG
jgi:hypothetical protein